MDEAGRHFREVARIVVLGAAGDLVTRHLWPGLGQLLDRSEVPDDLQVVGVGREPLSDEQYRELVAGALAEHAAYLDQGARAGLVRRLSFRTLELGAGADLREVLGAGPVVVYLALPPSAYLPALAALAASGLPPGSRLVVEKPFGTGLDSARALNAAIEALVPERDVFRVDHFLHHQVVQDLLAVRFASPWFEPVWNRRYVERVDVVWEEGDGVRGRVDFYDATGALRDMVQSHLLEVLALVAMEGPVSLDGEAFRDVRVAALREVSGPIPGRVGADTARGVYGPGTLRGRPVAGYRATPGVDASRDTETYACLRLGLDTDRWRGVPMVLRSGKAVGEPRREIAVRFRPVEGPLPGPGSTLRLGMDAGGTTLELPSVGRDGLPDLALTTAYAARVEQSLTASARILRDVLAGRTGLFVRDDEVEQAWRVSDAVSQAWRSGVPPLQEYAAGSAGPRLPGDSDPS